MAAPAALAATHVEPGLSSCPPDTEPYDADTHKAPPMDAPVAECYVPVDDGVKQGPDKQPVPLKEQP